MILSINPLSQRDSRWAPQRLGTVDGVTIGSDGCIVTDMAMLATYYGHLILPNELDNILTDSNLYYDGDLFVNGSITKIFPDISFDSVVFCESTPAPLSQIKSYLNQGKPSVVALMNQGVRHYILIVGFEVDRIFANDPWQGDQVAINDRWGDPATKILQVNFFSGPVIIQTIPFSSPIVSPVLNPITPSPVIPIPPNIDPGGDDGGTNILTPVPMPSSVVQPVTPIVPPFINQPVITPIPQVNPQVSPSSVNIVTPNIDYSAIQNSIVVGFNTLKDQLTNAQINPVVANAANKTANQIFIDSLKSRKFILSLLAAVVAFLNSKFNLGLTQNQLSLILIPMLVFIIVEGIADIVGRAKTPA